MLGLESRLIESSNLERCNTIKKNGSNLKLIHATLFELQQITHYISFLLVTGAIQLLSLSMNISINFVLHITTQETFTNSGSKPTHTYGFPC